MLVVKVGDRNEYKVAQQKNILKALSCEKVLLQREGIGNQDLV